jgi:hypothetical protein
LPPHFWNITIAKVAVALGLITAVYYAFVQKDWHPLHHAAHEYVSFMALVGSLFVISGGINIRVKGEATPMVNTIFLLMGAVLANLIGTTGASMLLIRPWIKMNKYRITGLAHRVLHLHREQRRRLRSLRSAIRRCSWASCAACRSGGCWSTAGRPGRSPWCLLLVVFYHLRHASTSAKRAQGSA